MSEGKPKPPSELAQYAKSLLPHGCKHGLEPVPHDHLVAYMDARYGQDIRIWACLVLHQFPRRHRNPAKPYATCCNHCGGRAGLAMQPKHIGKHLDTDEGNVRQRLQHLESENRVEWDRDKYIAVTGDFTLPATETPLDDPGEKCCTHLWPGYLLNEINKLTADEIARLNAKESARQTKFETLQADFRSALRFIGDEEQDNMLLTAVGVTMRRNEYEPHDPDRQAEYAARQARLLVVIPEIRKVVHTFEPEVCTTPENGVVQDSGPSENPMNTGVPGAPTEVTEEDKLASEPAPPTPREIPEQEMFEHLAEIARAHRLSLQAPNNRTLHNFWEVAMRCNRSAGAADVAQLVVRVLRDNPGLKTWGGVFKEFRKQAEEGAKERAAAGAS